MVLCVLMNKMNRKRMSIYKQVTVGDMVYLPSNREGIVRFKGKTSFGLGEWYGIELRTCHQTRHNGLILGKRYFRCPRNKGLFIRKQIIIDVMDKKTALQKSTVFKISGTHAYDIKNNKIRRKYKPKPAIIQSQTCICSSKTYLCKEQIQKIIRNV
eukprot:UN00136